MFNLFKKEKDNHIGQVMVKEVLPLYSDRWLTTNKSFLIIKKKKDSDLYECHDYGYETLTETKYYNKNIVLTQNGTPIKVTKNFKIIYANLDFSKEGYKKGQIWHFEKEGHLANLSSTKKVYLCTDKFVLFQNDNGNILGYSYEELRNRCKELI